MTPPLNNFFVLSSAITVLKNGGVVVFPTETAYGFAVDATNQKAVERLIKMKGRDVLKTFPLIVSSIEMAKQYIELTPQLRKLADKYWPGSLTIIAQAKVTKLASSVIRDDGTIAMRVSSHDIARVLSEKLGAPITATSANVSGQPACYSVSEVRAQFENKKDQPDFFIDGGVLTRTLPSTIVKEENGKIVVVRQGEIQIKH